MLTSRGWVLGQVCLETGEGPMTGWISRLISRPGRAASASSKSMLNQYRSSTFSSTIHTVPPLVPFPLARIGQPHLFFFTLFAFATSFTVVSAQDASVLNPLTNSMISDGLPLRDDGLLYPLYGQLASNQIDGSSVP